MLNTLKLLLGIDTEDNGKNELLSFVIDDCEAMVCGYCGIDTIPDRLSSVIVTMAADMYRRKNYGSEEPPKSVKTIAQGDRSISFESAALDTDSFLKEYEARLKPFRRGRVPSDLNTKTVSTS